MRFERRFMMVLGVSLGWALLVSATFYKLASGRAGHGPPAQLKQIVFAIRPLSAGGLVDRPSVALRGVPEALVPKGSFSKLEDVIDRPVISGIQADEPVMDARLALKGSGAGLGPMIPPGMRAVSVRVNDVVGVAGFVLPGTRVDVLVTGKPPSRMETETQTVLQNITVLSAGQTTLNDGKSQPIVTPVVTLLVTPAEAEALTLAINEGHIQLVLRNSTDQTPVATRGRRLIELYGAQAAAPPEEPPMAAAVPVTARAQRVGAPRTAEAARPPEIRRAAVVEPEFDQMMMIRGAVKKIESFSKEQETK
ncbi:MAG: Flp pilus assembly protein CpaB [Candidatus Solibacter sp.]